MDENILDYGYFRLAKNAMKNSDFDPKYRMGAVIVGKRPISFGFNKMKTHPRYPKLYSIHAELAAILSAETDVSNSEIWVYREMANHMPGMARPCDTCMGAILEAKIKRIYYSTKLFPYWEVIEL